MFPKSSFQKRSHGREPKLIYVSPDQLNQVEFLIQQSIQGHHPLFDQEKVREIFQRAPYCEFTEADAYEMEHHIERLLTKPTLEQKREYLAALHVRVPVTQLA